MQEQNLNSLRAMASFNSLNRKYYYFTPNFYASYYFITSFEDFLAFKQYKISLKSLL